MTIPEVAPYYMLVVDRIDNTDRFEVQVEIRPEYFSDEVRALEEIRSRIAREILSALGISAGVRLVEPHTIQRSEGKAARIIDKRKLY